MQHFIISTQIEHDLGLPQYKFKIKLSLQEYNFSQLLSITYNVCFPLFPFVFSQKILLWAEHSVGSVLKPFP